MSGKGKLSGLRGIMNIMLLSTKRCYYYLSQCFNTTHFEKRLKEQAENKTQGRYDRTFY